MAVTLSLPERRANKTPCHKGAHGNGAPARLPAAAMLRLRSRLLRFGGSDSAAQILAWSPRLTGRPNDAAPRNSTATNGSEPTTHSSCPGGIA